MNVNSFVGGDNEALIFRCQTLNKIVSSSHDLCRYCSLGFYDVLQDSFLFWNKSIDSIAIDLLGTKSKKTDFRRETLVVQGQCFHRVVPRPG